MKVFLTQLQRIQHRWEDSHTDWYAYDDEWFCWASASSKELLIKICEKQGWDYEDYVRPKRKPITWKKEQ